MSTTYTSNKIYALQATGDNPNTWGTVLNTNVFTVIDSNLGGSLSISVAGSADVTPTQTQVNNVNHVLTGALTGNINYIFPASQGGFFRIHNNTSGAFSVTAKPSGGTGLSIPQGSKMLFFINGTTNALEPMFDTLANISVSSSTAPANGLYLASTNTPTIAANSLPVVWFQSAASSVNYFLILGQATGQAPAISVLGADSNISMNFGTKGTGAFNFYTNSTAQQFSITHVASAVNYISVNGKQAGSDPNLSVVGADTNISLVLSSKGTGSFSFQSAAGEQFGITNTSSVVNRLRVTGSATGGSVSIFINGTDSNVGILYNSKGTGAHAFYTNGGSQQQFGITHVASAVNYISVSGNVTGSGPVIAVLGSDSNVSFSYNAKGTGSHTFYTGGGSYTQFQILNTTNAVNYLTVFGNATGGSPFIQAAGSDTDVGIVIYAKNGGNIAIGTNGITLLKVGGDSTVAINTAQLATNATNGFLWITSSAGAPTGVATAPYTGACALHYDATNNKIYVRSGGTWRSTAALT